MLFHTSYRKSPSALILRILASFVNSNTTQKRHEPSYLQTGHDMLERDLIAMKDNYDKIWYADNLLFHRPIYSPSDYQTLQADIDALSDWISANKLQFNCDKCKCMLVS